ncbi:MAG TPA: EI24 domain-containing protein [Allosphingosinicella sp.]|nr:EI24 domain-containing protein [Allosphingosinicella sp.]
MIRAFRLALAQLGDPRIRAVLVKSVLLTLALFAAAAALIGWALAGANPCGWGPLDQDCTIGGGASVLIALALGAASLWLLFPALAIGVLGFFSDEVVEAVEARHYPAAAAAARRPGTAEGLALGLRSAGRLLLWNAMALPFYVLLLVTGIGPFLLFFAINAVALGRDLGEMVAVRRHRGAELERWLAANRVRRAALGLVVTFLFTIPFANLLAPVVGAAMATHLFREEGR